MVVNKFAAITVQSMLKQTEEDFYNTGVDIAGTVYSISNLLQSIAANRVHECIWSSTKHIVDELETTMRNAGAYDDMFTLTCLGVENALKGCTVCSLLPSVVDFSSVFATSTDLDLETVIENSKSEGLDAERITWFVIVKESLKHLGLVRKEASKFTRKYPDVTMEDLLGHGWLGLRVALRKYDPSLGYKFSTYACPRINGFIRDGVRADGPLPKRLTTFVRAANNAEEILVQKLSRKPTFNEIGAYLEASSEHLKLLPHLGPAASLEEMTSVWGESHHEPSCLIDSAHTENEGMQNVAISAVHQALATLPVVEQDIIRLTCFEEVSLAQTARDLNVDLKTVKSLKKKALSTLGEQLGNWREAYS